MDANASRRGKINMGLNGLIWIHVNALHEPPWLVRTNRQKRQIDRSEASSNILEERSICASASEKEPSIAKAQHEPAPESAISIEETPRREVICRGQAGRRAHRVRGLPPIKFFDASDSSGSHEPAITDRCNDKR